jgi:hypothetical protein
MSVEQTADRMRAAVDYAKAHPDYPMQAKGLFLTGLRRQMQGQVSPSVAKGICASEHWLDIALPCQHASDSRFTEAFWQEIMLASKIIWGELDIDRSAPDSDYIIREVRTTKIGLEHLDSKITREYCHEC